MDFSKFAIAIELFLVITIYIQHQTIAYYSTSSGLELQILELDSNSGTGTWISLICHSGKTISCNSLSYVLTDYLDYYTSRGLAV